MNVLIVTDTYPPLRTSGAQQIYDLGQAFIQEHHQVTIVTPEPNQTQSIDIQTQEGIQVVRVKCFQTKDVNYIQRTAAELINPFVIWSHLKSSQIMNQKIDVVIWYSPSIFWGPLVKRLKAYYQCKSYLILRDIFPDWAKDLGLIKNGPVFWFLKAVEKFQYEQADRIGVQTPNSLTYFVNQHPNLKDKCEVLWIWIGEAKAKPCSIDLSQTSLKGRSIFVYAGNMGVAQNMDCLLDLAGELKDRKDVGFVFVGRGSEVARLSKRVSDEGLSNTLFFDEIEADEIPALYEQCKVGMLTLDTRHRTQNIPGKFLTYLSCGLEILAFINNGNDLEGIIVDNNLGLALTQDCLGENFRKIQIWLDLLGGNKEISIANRDYCNNRFSTKLATNQIIKSLI